MKSCASILGLAQRAGVEMPIVEAVKTVIDGTETPPQMIASLMARSASPSGTRVLRYRELLPGSHPRWGRRRSGRPARMSTGK